MEESQHIGCTEYTVIRKTYLPLDYNTVETGLATSSVLWCQEQQSVPSIKPVTCRLSFHLFQKIHFTLCLKLGVESGDHKIHEESFGKGNAYDCHVFVISRASVCCFGQVPHAACTGYIYLACCCVATGSFPSLFSVCGNPEGKDRIKAGRDEMHLSPSVQLGRDDGGDPLMAGTRDISKQKFYRFSWLPLQPSLGDRSSEIARPKISAL